MQGKAGTVGDRHDRPPEGKRQEIEKWVRHDLKKAGEIAVAAKVKSDIDAELARFNTSLSEVSAKAHS